LPGPAPPTGAQKMWCGAGQWVEPADAPPVMPGT